ncbi:MAG: methyltransferase [Clostridia bacterium]|nr:methyltransferase [Clostridia bacterium]
MDKAVMKKEPIGNGRFIYVSSEHTFGTDAVLLADFAKPKSEDIAVDIGTGCGIIPFLMLRDGKVKSVTGIDIAPEAVKLAQKTAKEEGFDNFIGIISNITDIKGKITLGDKTLVTCNPPYKAAGTGIKAQRTSRLLARQETEGTMEDIVLVASRMLTSGGRLCMCQRPERLAELICLMSKYRVEPKRIRLVSKTVGSQPWLVLIEGRRDGKVGLKAEPTLYIYENGELSEEMKKIYGPYKEAHL